MENIIEPEKTVGTATGIGKLILTPRQLKNFWNKVDKNGPIQPHAPHLGPCWVWKGFIGENGYGQFRVGKRKVSAHRVSFEIHIRALGENEFSLHQCDFKPCINYQHLFSGTQMDNFNDMVRKGRMVLPPSDRPVSGDEHYTRRSPELITWRGERQHLSKLKNEDIPVIRGLIKDGLTNPKIAEIFHVCSSTVGHIRTGKTWRHIL